MIASGEDSPEALSGFVKFHPQYPVLKVPGGASRPPCASRSRLARGCILRASPPRVKGKFGFGRIYCGARADSAEPSGFSQLMQSLPRGPCRPSLWRSLHNLPSTAQSFRDSRDRSFAFHGASSAAWAKAPAVPLDWPISVAASAIDQGRPAGRWPACRPSHRSGAAAPTATAPPRSPGRRARPSRRRIRDGQPSVFHGGNPAFPNPAGPMQPSAGCAIAPPRRRTHGSGSRRGRPRPADARRWASPFFGVLLAGSMAASSRGPPLRERGLRTSGASSRPPMPGFASSPPPNPNPPRFRRRLLRRLRAAASLGPIGPFELGGAEAAKRRMRPRPVADCLDAPEQVRRGLLARGAGARERPGLAMPMRDEDARLRPGA